jgi:hypothetical protein
MIDVENERALAKKTEARADDIFRIVRAEIILACGGELQFMAIMLGEVHAKIGRLLAEVEQKAQADG